MRLLVKVELVIIMHSLSQSSSCHMSYSKCFTMAEVWVQCPRHSDMLYWTAIPLFLLCHSYLIVNNQYQCVVLPGDRLTHSSSDCILNKQLTNFDLL